MPNFVQDILDKDIGNRNYTVISFNGPFSLEFNICFEWSSHSEFADLSVDLTIFELSREKNANIMI